ncbi:MAG: DUF4422 domain-containing protein [Methanobrevibacter millerae]|uniref:DUF4422 domain-containing protein n=1 Tax=Methanobrevibacter millerae TaxID=230361 RepID=A0A8T3VM57_9EURY|nr:DUF4422 domain-containing protein [Methanobrevibacter millerae]MBE6505284.1 DUF4422 domain-containing protein [Methanobrevibacter millerae]
MTDMILYILTHKKFNEKYDSRLYKPLLNGSALLNDDFGYLRDDSGQNISKFNIYYAELTGQYWAWKNSNADIIGFTHYRRWFVRDIRFNKLTKNDILNDLKDNDIILPQKTRVKGSIKENMLRELEKNPEYGVKWEDYVKLGDLLKNKFSEYYDTYIDVLNGRTCYNNNMFICSFELADKYFEWLFNIFNLLKEQIDFSKYPKDNKRVFGFFSEILLTVFVTKHELKIKEHYILLSERKMPLIHILIRRFPIISTLEESVGKIVR